MYFATLTDLFYMNGHGVYVWSVYAVAAVIIGALIATPTLDRRRFLREEAQRQRRAAGGAGPGAASVRSSERASAQRPRLSTQLPNSGG